jgi:hypothetical protein
MRSKDSAEMCPEPVGLRSELVEGHIPEDTASFGRKTSKDSRNVMTRAFPFCRSVEVSEQGADKSARLNSDPETPVDRDSLTIGSSAHFEDEQT